MADPPRRLTDIYLAAVERAVAAPGRWTPVRTDFKTRMNAQVTANCLAGGYLRVKPRKGDREVRIKDKRYIATRLAVETRVTEEPDGLFGLEVRAA